MPLPLFMLPLTFPLLANPFLFKFPSMLLFSTSVSVSYSLFLFIKLFALLLLPILLLTLFTLLLLLLFALIRNDGICLFICLFPYAFCLFILPSRLLALGQLLQTELVASILMELTNSLFQLNLFLIFILNWVSVFCLYFCMRNYSAGYLSYSSLSSLSHSCSFSHLVSLSLFLFYSTATMFAFPLFRFQSAFFDI